MTVHRMPKQGSWGEKLVDICDTVNPGDTVIVHYKSQLESLEQGLRSLGIENVTLDYQPLTLTVTGEITPERTGEIARRLFTALTGRPADSDEPSA